MNRKECTNCGGDLKEDAFICTHCGELVRELEERKPQKKSKMHLRQQESESGQ